MSDFSASWKPVTFLSCDKLSDYMWFHSQKSQEVTLTQVTGGLIDWLIDELTDWLMDWLTVGVTDWLRIDWLMNWLTDDRAVQWQFPGRQGGHHGGGSGGADLHEATVLPQQETIPHPERGYALLPGSWGILEWPHGEDESLWPQHAGNVSAAFQYFTCLCLPLSLSLSGHPQ